MSATMFELATMREQLEALVAEQDGELTPDLEAAWDAIDEKFETKVENTALFIRELLSTADAIKAEEQRLTDRRKAREAKAERLKVLLLDALQRFGKERVNGLLVTVATQKNQPSVVVLTPMDENELRNIATFAPQYVRHRETWELNKEAIKDAHKAGTLDADVSKRVKITQTLGLRIR